MRFSHVLCVFGLFAFCGTAAVVSSQVPTQYASVDLSTAKLVWTWTQGSGGPVEKWRVSCGTQPGTYTLVSEWPSPEARWVYINQVVPGPGSYTCIVQGVNTAGPGPSGPSVTFQTGSVPSVVQTLVVQP